MNTTDTPRKWGHITIPDNAVMTPRGDVQPGDTVISSHYGKRTVLKAATRGLFPGTTYLTFDCGHTDCTHSALSEAYPANLTIPVVPA